MLCGIGSHNPVSHQHHHRFLRSFRSHKSLWQHHDSSSDDMPHYHTRPSDASSLDRSRSPRRPSTSTTRSDLSVDWDPLRLHPPLAPGPAPPLQDAAAGESFSRRHQPHGPTHARSSHNLGHQSPYQHSHSSSSPTVIYDGFDFGFGAKPTPAVSRPRRRDASPAPSDASSACSSLSGSDESLLAHGGLAGLAPAPAPRSRPGPRPRPHPSDLDEADFFMRRRGWKRRGIVFVNTGPLLAGEDETFEI